MYCSCYLGQHIGLAIEEGATYFKVGLWLEQFFERRSGDRTRVDGVCDFEKGLGLGLGLGSGGTW